ncbi:hypothetical protein ACIBJC_06755 [Streptomyces sp. NPDC050509]|uniref:hypothetical protein n=1 Tax=Streptomyces sp. NPDC050509 TaxID=3365620 RepID=UPI00379B0495
MRTSAGGPQATHQPQEERPAAQRGEYADRMPTRVAVSGRTTNRLFLTAGTSARTGWTSGNFFLCSTLPEPA